MNMSMYIFDANQDASDNFFLEGGGVITLIKMFISHYASQIDYRDRTRKEVYEV